MKKTTETIINVQNVTKTDTICQGIFPIMRPGFRKFMLTAHITFSIGWLGAVAGFLVLAITGLTSHNSKLVHAAYPMMELIGWFVIVPLCIGSLLTGVFQSLGTQW